MRAATLVLAFTCAWSQTNAQEMNFYDTTGSFAGRYLCVGDAAGGVAYDKTTQHWHSATFDVSKNKVIVSVKSNGLYDYDNVKAMGYQITVRPFGEQDSDCRAQTVHSNGKFVRDFVLFRNGRVSCVAGFQQYEFSFSRLRYLSIYYVGFVDSEDEIGNTPNIEIGECTRID